MSEETFRSALRATFAFEGLYSNDSRDPGGETYRGISRRTHPEWPGWAIVDRARGRRDFPACLAGDPELDRLTAELYRVKYWQPLRCDELPEAIAPKVFDIGVNLGIGRATKLLQQVCGVEPDGAIGPDTLRAANTGEPKILLGCLRAAVGGYYRGLIVGRPDLAVYLNGWLRRAAA
jgi:lysozyme family protein